jgi:hypothetical protein
LSTELRIRGQTPRELKGHRAIEMTAAAEEKEERVGMDERKLTCEDDERGGGRCDGGRDRRRGRRE